MVVNSKYKSQFIETFFDKTEGKIHDWIDLLL